MLIAIKNNQFSQFGSDKASKGTTVNRACHHCMEGNLKLRLNFLYKPQSFSSTPWIYHTSWNFYNIQLSLGKISKEICQYTNARINFFVFIIILNFLVLWNYSQISTNSSNVVLFCRKSLLIMRNYRN